MQLGGMGFIHYNISLEEQLAVVQQAKGVSPVAAAPGRPEPTVGPSGCDAGKTLAERLETAFTHADGVSASSRAVHLSQSHWLGY